MRRTNGMKDSPAPRGKEQALLRHARREGLVIMAVWTICLFWSMGVALVAGYQRDPNDIGLVLGMPDWVFWSVVFPWGICLLFSFWFCFFYMADDDLGEDRAGGPDHV
jgi:hypothetical protein